MDVASYWDERARQFAGHAPHKAAVYIDFSPLTHRLWASVQRAAVGRHVDLAKGSRALDLGCGTGRWLETFARRGVQGFGFDVAPTMRELARQAVAPFPSSCVVDRLDQVPDRSLDLVLSLNVLHVIHDAADLDAAIDAAALKLRTGGRFCIIVDQQPGAFVAGKSRSDWQRLIEPHGFRLVRVGAAEYSLPLTAYRKVVMAARSLVRGSDDHYRRSLEVYNKAGVAIRIHEALVSAATLVGLPLEWLAVGRGFVPPGASLLIMTFERRPDGAA